jgi:aquaporin Z
MATTLDMGHHQTTTVVLPPLARKLIAELIGTFFLVFTVGASVRDGSTLAPLAIGAVLMVMIYAAGHVSGAHVNPAVTLAVLVRGRITLGEAGAYWIAQFVAAVLAALAVGAIVAPTAASAPAGTGHGVVAVFLAELVFTFALAYVVVNVATSKDHPSNSFYGLAIGFTVLAGAVAVGGISGAAFNPAVFLGGAMMGVFSWSMLWVYYVAQLAAGLLAGLAFRALNPDDK